MGQYSPTTGRPRLLRVSDESRPSPPVAEQRPHRATLHGITREDPYAWLRDDAWQEVMRDPSRLRDDVRSHLEAENAYTSARLAPTEALQEVLLEEMKGRIQPDESSVPARDGPWEYYQRYETGAQHPRWCRREAGNTEAAEQVLYDGDAAAKDQAYFQIGAVSHAPDHGHLAYAVDDKGSEYYEIRFVTLDGGDAVAEALTDSSGSMAWSADGTHLFYTVVDDHHRPCKVLRHRLGDDPSDDVVVYEEKDPGFFVGVGATEDHGHVVVHSHDHTTSEAWLIPGDDPTAAPACIEPRQRDVEYEVSQQGDTLVILTNYGPAEDFAIMTAPVATPGREHWRPLIPHRAGRLILSVHCYRDWIVRLEREEALPRIVVRQADGEEHAIEFDESAYSLAAHGSYEFDTDMMRFSYSSPTTPQRVFDYDMRTRGRELRKEQLVPSGHDPTRYRTARIMARSHDGAQVPVSILWHRDTPIDGSAPVLLYGYGSYGITIPADFRTTRLSLVDRGFVYAIAHIRGGKARGYAWYRDGKAAKKTNTFHDFIAAAQALIDEGYGRAGEITIQGGSAGGMLVGAAANLRPDLWRAVVGEVPFVDVLTTMCDADLPLTPPEWPEWGNPIEDEEAYRYIANYSPYDNVSATAYPWILATAGLTDPRVTYWEPAKWVARLRERGTGDAPILLRTYMEAGHGGAAGRYDKLGEVALVYAFMLLAHDRVETAPLASH